MRAIVGLGNPGEKYKNNRHNVGFLFVDYLINLQSQNSNVKTQKMFHVSCFMFHDLIFAKPQTFMNLSGKAVKSLTTYYKLRTTNLMVIHDDLDIPLGKFRIDLGRGPKMHNGITSIEQHLKTGNFWRVRIGVDNRQQTGPMNGEDYVLQNFRPEEKKFFEELFPEILERIKKEFLNSPS